MLSSGTSEGRQLKGNRLTQVHLEIGWWYSIRNRNLGFQRSSVAETTFLVP